MRARLTALDPFRVDVLLAVALTVVGQVSAWDDNAHHGSRGLAAALSLVLGLALSLRRRAPLALALTLGVVLVVQASAGPPLDSLWAFLVLLLSAFSIGAYAVGRHAPLGGAIVLLGVYAAQLTDAASSTSDKVFTPAVIVGGPWLAGRLVRRYGTQARELDLLNVELEQRRAQELEQAIDLERARIARELHDVIAHSISVMVVQAGAAERLASEGLELEALRSIRRTGKSALGEMRRLLGVLRSDDGADTLRPQPGLAELPEMAARMRAAGVAVELDLAPGLPALQPGPDLVVYRVVQEALTNTLKHAGSSTAHVRVRYDGQAMEIEATDAGGVPADGRPGVSGHGLTGMRERLALYDGVVDVGPTRAGGWRVHARLPLDAEALQ